MDLRQEPGIVRFREGSENQANCDGIGCRGGSKEHVDEEPNGGIDAAVAEAGGDGGVPGDCVARGKEVEKLEDVVYRLGFGCRREEYIGSGGEGGASAGRDVSGTWIWWRNATQKRLEGRSWKNLHRYVACRSSTAE